jgi:hypothetical protein
MTLIVNKILETQIKLEDREIKRMHQGEIINVRLEAEPKEHQSYLLRYSRKWWLRFY